MNRRLELLTLLETMNYEIKKSKIHKKGVFAKISFTPGVNLSIAFKLKSNKTQWNDKNVTRTELGQFMNHSNVPNVKIVKSNRSIFYVTIKNIKKGQELFVDYNTIPFKRNIPL